MDKRLLGLVTASVLALLRPGDLAAQCRTAADTAHLIRGQVKRVYAKLDSSSISLVTDENTCLAAVNAYNQTLGSGIQSAYVIALGRSGYIVVDPDVKSGEYMMMLVYDSSWAFKHALGG